MSLFSLNKPPYFSVFAEQTEKSLVCSWVCPNNIIALLWFARLCSRVRTNYPKAGLSALPLLFIVGQRYKARQQSGNQGKDSSPWMKRLIENHWKRDKTVRGVKSRQFCRTWKGKAIK